jgi:tetratricopeptide (TPR) repeat protein
VAEICIRLDGLPLAIELAAARTRLLSPAAMLSRLEHRLELLTGGARDLPARQQTLRSTIDWSYGLLRPTEQRLFARLGVFGGGWTLDAAEEVCDGELGLEPLEGVASLLDKSLLRCDERASDGRRFEMLETIREFALDRLAAGGEEEDARRRHAEYYRALAEESEEQLAGPAQGEWLARLEAEQDNFRSALAWSLAGGSSEQGLRIAAALGTYWGAHDQESEGRRWLEQELAACPDAPPELRARALHAAGALALEQGDAGPGEALLGEALTLFRTRGDARGTARTLALMAAPAAYEGAYDRAAALCAESMAFAREAGDLRTVAVALNNLAATANLQAEYGEARRLLEQSLELRRKLGDARGVAYSLNNLGYNSLLEEDHERARSELEEALLLAEQLRNKDLTALALGNLGLVALYQRDVGRASLRFERALALCRELDNRRLVPECLLGLAGVAALAAQPVRSARLAGAAEGLRAQLGSPLLPSERIVVERLLPLAEATLGRARFAAERDAGRGLGLDQALAEALDTSPESEEDRAEVA